MLFYKIKCFFNKNKEVSADFSLNKQIKSMMNATFSPLDKSVAPAVMNEIKNSRKYKNNFVYKFNYRIVPIALSILFIFTATGIYTNNFATIRNSEDTSFSGYTSTLQSDADLPQSPNIASDESSPSIRASSPATENNNKTIEKESKIKVFFNNVLKFLKETLKISY